MKKDLITKVTICGFTFAYLIILAAIPAKAQNADNILLKDYRPVSIFKVPVSHIERAAYPIIDVHTHNYAKNEEELKEWIKAMDACGIERSVVLTESSGPRFDSIYSLYSKYKNRFDVWCGFDYMGYDKPGWSAAVVKELERCFKK